MSYRIDRGLTALVAVLALTACGGGGDQPPAAGGAGGAAGGAPAASPVDAATAGSVAGRVTFTGTPPAGTPVDMADEAVCARKHTTPVMQGGAQVGSDGGLANVFVYIKSGPGTTLTFPAATEQVTLDQRGCEYVPHVLAVQAGQPIQIVSSDSVLHNINATGGTNNRGFNRSQTGPGQPFTVNFTAAEVMVPVKCDVHGWMHAFVGVTSHPYHAVTDASGAFSMPNVPPGDYEVEAWHEVLGTTTGTVTVAPSGRGEVNLSFTAEMAGRYVPMGPVMVLDHATGTLRPEAAVSHVGHR